MSLTSLQIGDKVQYLPAMHHAMHQDAQRDHAWVMGWKKIRHVPNPVGQMTPKEEMEELTEKRLGELLQAIRRHPNPQEQVQKLVFLRPKKPWPAVVTATNEDGTVDLDVTVGNGFTLHEKGVQVARAGHPYTGHSCIPLPVTVATTEGEKEVTSV